MERGKSSFCVAALQCKRSLERAKNLDKEEYFNFKQLYNDCLGEVSIRHLSVFSVESFTLHVYAFLIPNVEAICTFHHNNIFLHVHMH